METSTLDLSSHRLSNSLESFIKKEEAKNNPSDIEKENLSDTKEVKKAIEYGTQIIDNKKINYAEIAGKINKGELVTILTGWEGHAVSITIKGDMIAYSNRGQTLVPDAQPETKIYKIQNKEGMNEEFIKKLMDSDGDSKARMGFFEGKEERMNKPGAKATTLVGALNLELVQSIPKKGQKVGNCSWVSAKCSFENDLLLIKLDRKMKKNGNVPQSKANIERNIKAVMPNVKSTYKSFDLNHRKMTLNNVMSFIDDHNKNNEMLSPKDQFSVYSQLMQKFMRSIPPNTPVMSERSDIAKVCQGIIEKTKQVPISDAVISMEKCSREDANHAARLFVSREITNSAETRNVKERNLPGAFAIIEDNKGIQLHYCVQSIVNNSKQSIAKRVELKKVKSESGDYYTIEGIDKQFRTIEDIAEFVRQQCNKPNSKTNYVAYPVSEQALINEFKEKAVGRKY